MPTAALIQSATTIAEFDAFIDAQEDGRLWDLVAGQILAMTNPTDIHEQIVSNVGAVLKQAADARGCQAFFGGMRVQRSDDRTCGDKPRPDLLVRCGALTGRNCVTDPLIVVEVLSPSTIDIDRGDKLRFYKSLPTLRHIALVHQDQVRIEHHRRVDRGWRSESLADLDEMLLFAAIPCEMKLRQAYFDLDLAGA